MKREPRCLRLKTAWTAYAAYLYMSIPVCIFFLGWLRHWIGVVCVVILGAGLWVLFRSRIYDRLARHDLQIRIRTLVGLAIAVAVFCWLAGQGGFFYQTEDNYVRNAIFRDLITHSWPVIYAYDGSALVYYLAQWLVPALVGKGFGWTAANLALFIWDWIGVYLAVLLMLHYVGEARHAAMVFKVFILWGGLNVLPIYLGNVFFNAPSPLRLCDEYLNYWQLDGPPYQFTCNFALLQWVYNQTIVPWIAVPLLMLAPDAAVYGILGMLVLPYAPFPFVGIAIMMLVSWIRSMPGGGVKRALRPFSIPNLCAFATILPVFGLYYGSNNMATGNTGYGGFGWMVEPTDFSTWRMFVFLLFAISEFGITALILHRRYRWNMWYWIAVLSLLVIPHFRVGTSTDFCMRTSIPVLQVLAILTMKFFSEADWNRRLPLRVRLMCLCMLIMSVNVFKSVGYAASVCIETRQFPYTTDIAGSIKDWRMGLIEDADKADWRVDLNCCSFRPWDTFFYKHLAG